jgi:hypothetical protein
MMGKTVVMAVLAAALSFLSLGCGRMFTEGLGEATGASGKVVEVGQTSNLANYQGLSVEAISVKPGMRIMAGMPEMIRSDLAVAGAKRGLSSAGAPRLRLTGEITYYEPSSTTDTVIGPLTQVIVSVKLIDVKSGQVVAAAELVGRAQATSASGATSLSAGVGKAFGQWLESSGLKKSGN